MSTFDERLASFTNWPHTSPNPEDLADAGFSHQPTSKDPDTVICQVYKTSLYDWEPEDDPIEEHYSRSKSCIRFPSKSLTTIMMFVQDVTASLQKDSQASSPQASPIAPQASLIAPQPSPKDIGFLDPSLQHDFPDLCLFHDAYTFCDRIERCRSESGFLGADILELLPKYLRGEALKWFRQLKYQDLAVCIRAMRARFPQAAPQVSSQEAPPQAISQSACRAPDYHHCKLCNASFSSMARLIKHTQENLCNKPSCRHCDKVFSSKNRLYQHLREECQKQIYRQSSSASSSLSLPAYSPTYSPISLLPLSPPPTYRILSPPPPTYKVVKNFLTVEDLYVRYTPRYLKMDDLFRMFGQRSATTKSSAASISAAPTVALKHLSIRHHGRCLAKKGDGSTQMPKHLPKYLPKHQNQKNHPLIRTPLQLTPYKSVLPLRRSRSTLPSPRTAHQILDTQPRNTSGH